MRDALKARAVAALDLPAGSDADAAVARFLRKLPDEDFVPPAEWLAALAAFGVEVPLPSDAIAALDAFEFAEVDAFRTVYWSLAPAERITRWKSLKESCKSKPAQNAIAHLEAGLGMLVQNEEDAARNELAAVLRECYVLPPRARAVRRAQWLSERSKDFDWAAAAEGLRTRSESIEDRVLTGEPESFVKVPEMPDLFQPIVADVAMLDRLEPQLFRTVVTGDPKPTVVPELSEEEVARLQRQRARRVESNRERHKNTQESDHKNIALVILAVGVIFVCAGAADSFKKKASSAAGSSSVISTKKPPSEKPPKVHPDTYFTLKQVAQFKAYKPGSGLPEPPGYSTWKTLMEEYEKK